MDGHESAVDDESVVVAAAAVGFRLVQYETDAGQRVWEWRRGQESRPQFVTRRVAIHWMTELLARERTVAFVSNVGLAYARQPSGDAKPTDRMVEGAGEQAVREGPQDDSTSGRTES